MSDNENEENNIYYMETHLVQLRKDFNECNKTLQDIMRQITKMGIDIRDMDVRVYKLERK